MQMHFPRNNKPWSIIHK